MIIFLTAFPCCGRAVPSAATGFGHFCAPSGTFVRPLRARNRQRAPEHAGNIRGKAGETVLVCDPAGRGRGDKAQAEEEITPMLRAILKRQFRDAASGMTSESFTTLDFDEPDLEELLRSGGFREGGFEAINLIGFGFIDEHRGNPMTVIDEVAAERQRQITGEGYSRAHDDHEHDDGSIAIAAACYALPLELYDVDIWPWAGRINRKDRRRDLVRAAALLVAEIERLDRACAIPPSGRGDA
jgi:hypothetical protein